jgi:hypothetical protein
MVNMAVGLSWWIKSLKIRVLDFQPVPLGDGTAAFRPGLQMLEPLQQYCCLQLI